MPRPFGAWAPATNLNELSSRTPRPWNFRPMIMHYGRKLHYYNPEAMAHFKDPQQFKDAVDKLRSMTHSDKFFGDGLKRPHYLFAKVMIPFGAYGVFSFFFMQWLYGSHMPATNPSWRKVMNKEWEEAINNSPWDHRSHVWMYSDVYAACLGNVTGPGQRKFYIPA